MRKRLAAKNRLLRTIPWPLLALLLSVTFFSGIMYLPNASAEGLPLTVGNVQFTISDYGVIVGPVIWNYVIQTHLLEQSYLTVYHSAYPSGGGSTDVASGYGAGTGDFTVDEYNVFVQQDDVQETYSSFTQTGVLGVSNDLKIYQTAFAKTSENWVILSWKLENIYGTAIDNLRVGMNFRAKIGGTPMDDIDHWNAADSVYYIEDSTTGTTTMGFASADSAAPLNQYYGNPAGQGGAVDPSDDKSLHQSLTSTKVHGSANEISCMVGWNVGNLAAGANVTLPLIISFGTRYQDLVWAISKAKEFLVLQSIGMIITEVQDFASTDNVKIEVFNTGKLTIPTSDIYLSPSLVDIWDAGIWSSTTISPGQYSVYSLGPGEEFASREGGIISLRYSTGYLLDSVSFGQAGTAPDPLRDETIARYWNGVNYSNEWVRDPTPTFGARNDRLGRFYPPPVVLNEIVFNAALPQNRFIELYYPGSVTVSLIGWTLVVDSEYPIPPITLNPNKRYFVLRGDNFPVSFGMDDGSTTGDNAYLYDGSGRLIDMVGWSTSHIQGQSMERVDDQAQWGYEGYDDMTSTADGWRFNANPTPQIVKIGPDQSKMVDVGMTATYDIDLYYFGSGSDVLDVTYVSSLGWTTIITDASYNPLTDSDGDMVPDCGMWATGYSIGLKVQVTAPLDPVTGNVNTVYVTATSSVNPNAMGTTILRTVAVIPPYVIVNESAYPDTIWVKGSPAFPQETTVTLNVTGAGTPLTWYMPQDTVFVIDNSGSMVWNDPSNLRLSGATDYVGMMKMPDRAASVQFTSSAFLVGGHHLTWNYPQVMMDIQSFPPPAGGTNIPFGLTIATDELIAYGDPAHVLVEILLTDGRNSGGAAADLQTIAEAQRAADNGIIIFTIGLLVGGDVNELLLQQVADITGGEYYRAPTAEALQDIYLGIFHQVMNIAGKRIDDPVNPNPMIRDILPPYIEYVPGSFRDENSNPLPPDDVTVNPDGSTTLDWNVDKILINQSWIVKFEVTSSLDGQVPVGVYPTSRVNYTKWDNSTESLSFPEVFVNVLVPEPVNPPILGIEADENDVHLSWTIPGNNISHYLIYASPDQRGFDFSYAMHSTLSDPNPTRTDWTDVGGASPPPREYYYTVRAVNNLGAKSVTSNTVGKFTRSFDVGLNAFSLPLEPLIDHDIEWYANSIPNTEYIEWMDATDHWVRHWRGDTVTRPSPLGIGEGFQIFLSSPATFNFVGTPAAMIRYQEGLGSAQSFRRGLTVLTDQDDVELFWAPAAGADEYVIYRTDDRMRFHLDVLTPIATVDGGTLSWTDHDAILTPTTWYYMVVPFSPTGREGSSAYTLGIMSLLYKDGHNAMGLPLKPTGMWTLDHYCENIQTATGMAYMTMGVWKFHATELPTGVYDPFIDQGEGYQLSLDGVPSRYTYVGY